MALSLRTSTFRLVGMGLVLGLPVGNSAAQSSPPPCEPVWHTGGGLSRAGYDVVYSLSNDATGATVEGVIVVRAPDTFRKLPSPRSRPLQWQVNGVPRAIGGATVGPLWLGHEQSTNAAWLDSLPITLGANNVLLVQVDSNGAPQLAGQARIDPRVSLPKIGCEPTAIDGRDRLATDGLMTRLLADSAVHAFLVRERQPNER